jgi:hypothetical protein
LKIQRFVVIFIFFSENFSKENLFFVLKSAAGKRQIELQVILAGKKRIAVYNRISCYA